MLYFVSNLQEWQNTKRNDTDYGKFMRVINTPCFMPHKTAFHQLPSSVSKWLMVARFVLLVHSSSCVHSVSLSQMQIYLYNSDDFDSLSAAIKERRIIAAMAIFFEVSITMTKSQEKCNLITLLHIKEHKRVLKVTPFLCSLQRVVLEKHLKRNMITVLLYMYMLVALPRWKISF